MKYLTFIVIIVICFSCSETTTLKVYDVPYALELDDGIDSGRVVGLQKHFKVQHIMDYKHLKHEVVDENPVHATIMVKILETHKNWLKVRTIDVDTLAVHTDGMFNIPNDYSGRIGILEINTKRIDNVNPFRITQDLDLSMPAMYVFKDRLVL